MTNRFLASVSMLCVVYGSLVSAQSQAASAADWELTAIVLGHKLGERVKLKIEGSQISGFVHMEEDVPLKGSISGSNVAFDFKESDGTVTQCSGRISGEMMSGDYINIDPHGTKTTGTWSAHRAAPRPPTPQIHEFLPREFYREFSSATEPALHIFPGDTVHTTSVDAGGTDERSVVRVLGGNPLTGPFYVEGAMPGDVLAISIKRLKLNRDWALSDTGLVNRALTSSFSSKFKNDWSDTRWHLDVAKGIAAPEKPSDALKNFSVPVHPMLGCIGVAPGFGSAPISSGDSGDFGGNMDFNLIGEGATVYLGVNQPGALLYLGDGHALQADGELNGNALETSMDILFSVDVLREKSIGTPRAENADFLMAIGFAGSLDEAFRGATSGLASWLKEDYSLSDSDVAVVLGTTIQYSVSEVADRNTGIVARIPKRGLAMLKAAATGSGASK
ncbi:MAG TPA: acetamidase/formamidase family protein [Candidatus Sulfotelmatobacter sp.]|jgi:acetamidase/formamidase|nr:acetamidase/formamidase family protein [Candidatus Sulfotelmatobacter sp.]